MKNQPSGQPPRSNFMTMLLIVAAVYLGVMLIMGPNQGKQDTRKASEVLAEMTKLNADLRDVSAQRLLPVYLRKVSEEGKAANKPQAEIIADELRGTLLVADTMHKSGLYYHEAFKKGKIGEDWGYRKLDKAYQLLKPKFESYHLDPKWKSTSVTVVPHGTLLATDRTAKTVYDELVRDLSPLAKAEPVFLIIPGYQLIDVLVQATGAVPGFSYWFAALLLAVVVRAVVWPLTQKQIFFGREMQVLQPRVKEIQEKYKDKKTGQVSDPAAFQAETMGLYKEYGINPMAGCFPALIQMPLFLAVFQSMHHYKFEFTKGTFLWVNPGATTFLGIPIGPNLGERDYILIAIYTVSMVISTLLMPISDPSNAKQQRIMGVSIALFASVFMFFYTLPSAFVLYWIFTNVLSTAQSLYNYRLPPPELKKVQTTKGGLVIDTEGSTGSSNGHVSPDFFGKTGTPKANKAKKKKKR